MSGRFVSVMAVALVVAGCTPTVAAGEGATTSTASSSTSVSTSVSTTSAAATETSTTVEGDPSLAGVQGVTRIAAGVDELAVAWRLIDPEGNYIGPVDVNGDPLLLEPIEGYADFSWMTQEDRFNMDHRIVDDLVLRCVSDTDPRFAELIARTGTLNWGDLPGQLSQMAFAVFYACKKGLQLPPFIESDRTPEMWAEMYAYFLARWDCMEQEAGMDFGPVGDLEEYTATNGDIVPQDSPYWSLEDATFRHLRQVCPGSPVGGYGAWNPGDPVLPEP